MGAYDDFILNELTIKNSIKNICRNFGFEEVCDDLYLKPTDTKVYLKLTNDYVMFFTTDKSFSESYNQIKANIEIGVYNERTFINYALKMLNI